MFKTLLEAAKAKQFGTLSKHENFFDEYDFNFKEIRGKKDLRILEIGVRGGGSLAMWRSYFDDPLVVGVDIDPECEKWRNDRVRICIADQGDEWQLRKIEKENGPFDVVIDDGGHTMHQQLTTFKTLFPLLTDGGIFVIEDLHTSYWPSFGGRGGSATVEYLKRMVDEIHYAAKRSPRASIVYWLKNKIRPFKATPRNEIQNAVRSLYVAESIAFVHKRTAKKDKLLKF